MIKSLKIAEILKNNDILIAIGLVTIIAMMIIPLPPLLLDILLTTNIATSIIILLVCLYTTEPLDYSSFPTILLISTLFRLGLNVSTTRLILLHGEAGEVVNAFGQFVVGGNYVVGVVIFAILVIINFMVITSGAGRVAEVTARFTLDAMPGKQLSIDGDLNTGLISEEEAKEKRKKLERASEFFGTMDGASKFVKGDATAGLVITAINVIGGFIIGMWQMGMDFQTSATTFTILTVGDGLVAQLPAIIISTATGLLVTRASGGENSLSEDIETEMIDDPKILAIVGGLLCLMGIIPGMPSFPFFLIGGILAGLAYYKFKNPKPEKETKSEAGKTKKNKKNKEGEEEEPTAEEGIKKGSRESVMELLSVEPMEIEIGYRLVSLLEIEQGGDLLERIAQIRRQTAMDYGIVLPSIRVRDNLQLAPNSYQIKLKGVPIEVGEVYAECHLAMTSGMNDPNLSGIDAIEPAFGLPALWIGEEQKEYAESMGYTVVSPSAVVSTHLTEVIKKNASDILSRTDVQQLLDNVKKTHENLIEDLTKESNISTAEIQIILQNLLRERVSIRDLPTILEAVSTFCRVSRNTDYITEQCRIALSRSICKQNLSDEGELLVITIAPEAENIIAAGISGDGQSLNLEPNFTRTLIDNINAEIEKALNATGSQPVILCSGSIRLAFRRLIERTFPQISILSYNEIAPNVKARSVGFVQMESVSNF